MDLSSEPPRRPALPQRRAFLGVHFQCCQCYGRLYQNRDATAYVGGCPRCGKQLRVEIGPGGSSERFFSAG